MDYTFAQGEYSDSEVLYDGCQEQPLDVDFSLPDYCPDIQRILKCQVTPQLSGHSIVGDRLESDGVALIRVLYLDAKGDTVRCCEMKSAFSSSIALKRAPDAGIANVGARVEYINCRATSPRRLDIHGAFSVCATVVEKCQREIPSCVEGDNVEQQQETVYASGIVGYGQQQFSVNEVLEISDGKPPAETILRSHARCITEEVKVVPNKLMVKGQVCIGILYSSGLDDTSLETMEYEVPFSQMIDCDGITEECTYDLQMSVNDVDVQAKSDSNGENMRFEIEAKLDAVAAAYRDTEVTLVTDAYSTKYEAELEYSQIKLTKVAETVSETSEQKITIDTGSENVSHVIDVWNEISSVSGELQNDKIMFTGKMNVCILAVNNEGTPFYLERMTDFSCEHPWNSDIQEVKVRCQVQVGALSYHITGTSGLEVSADLAIHGCVMRPIMRRIVSAVHCDETHAKDANRAALTIYFADAGEKLWDIARTYGTSVKAIQEENDLMDESTVEGGMLLIPV